MRRHRLASFVLVAGLGLLLSAAAGCGDRSYRRYIPSEASSRQALETALDAWQKGQRPENLTGTAPVVRVVDSQWEAGQKLAKYEILNEEPGDNGLTFFSVQLTLKGTARPQVVRYVVVGRDPLWVYRDADFTQQTKGM